MTEAYDTYDYISYWQERKYEHESEVIAIKNFLLKIPKISKILDIGCGFGRHTPYYIFKSKSIVLCDPSARALKEAKKRFKSNRKIKFLQSGLENLTKKLPRASFDFIMMVRVIHHIKNPDKAFTIIQKLLSPKGYFILEFPNKTHWKALLRNFLKGNFIFPIDIFPIDRRSKSARKKNSLPFLNYHPGIIKEKMRRHGFQIIETRSVSNIRNSFLKRNIPLSLLLFIERKFQKCLACTNFGPSIFILAQKKG